MRSQGVRLQLNALTLLLSVGALAGCYPHSQAYRGAFSGKIVDRDGHPMPGATVVVCTSEASSPTTGCEHRAEAWSDLEGRFQFSPVKERQWCCFGESPLPPTRLTACARDSLGRLLLASSVEIDASGATEPRILVAPADRTTREDACVVPK